MAESDNNPRDAEKEKFLDRLYGICKRAEEAIGIPGTDISKIEFEILITALESRYYRKFKAIKTH
jgi:hypothetical protein